MAELDKVLKGLDICGGDEPNCQNCPYYGEHGNGFGCETIMQRDALELLKIHYPRVIGITEITESHNALKEGCVWLETKFGALAPVFVQFPYKGEIRMYSPYYHPAKDTEINETWWPIESYEKIWRCWTFRPTDEQREETPWTE